MGLQLNGIGVSRGISIGHTYILQRDHIEVVEHELPDALIAQEVERLELALSRAKKQLTEIRDNIPSGADIDISAFIETHLLMLDDSMLRDACINIIREQKRNAEWALKLQEAAIVSVFEAMDDPYLATRKNDIEHVIQRVLQVLVYDDQDTYSEDPEYWQGKIIIADDLTPADTVVMQTQGVAGFITESGGQLSHTAILARSLGIPAIVGVHDARRYLLHDEPIILDGSHGFILAEPTKEITAHYRRIQRERKRRQNELIKLKDAPSVTLCDTPIKLQANIEIEEDLKALRKVNADGVGLYRTEFLYMNRDDWPDEEEHFKTYTRVLRALKGAPLTLRTVDLGGDKETEQLHNCGTIARNPALGLRGIRRCLDNPEIFLPQLRAILRASAKGPINIMYPMLTNLHEVTQLHNLLDDVKSSLRSKGYKYDHNIRVGGMIEVPSSAIIAGQFADTLDFLSIGTNDLIQYTLGIDRIDDQVNYLYDPLHPAVLTLIKQTIEAGHKANIPVSMCGEMAGDIRYTRLLLNLGLRNFSMPPNSLLEVKSVVRRSRAGRGLKITRNIMASADPHQQSMLLTHMNKNLEEITDR